SEIMREGRDVSFPIRQEIIWNRAKARHRRALHQRVRILREHLLVTEMRLVQENRIPRQSIPGLDGRVVDLRNSRIEQAIRSPGDEWPLAAECVRDPHAWRDI